VKNFYLDNEDIQFFTEHLDWSTIVPLNELDFKDREQYDYAPGSTADAVDSYTRVLTVLGEIAAEYCAPRSEDVDLNGASFDGGKVTYATGTSESLKLAGGRSVDPQLVFYPSHRNPVFSFAEKEAQTQPSLFIKVRTCKHQ